ncbi:MAG: glycosyltransferase family 4 protein [Planctomycetes bacterium]|nr:glycosyltransferase family 4 protein [Planctomycetota bacterium]
MVEARPTIAYLTAGGGGMYCGSCMRDNTLARALMALGCDVQLIPTYTPIRTDEENVAIDRVFFGGINVFLQQKLPLLRYLPGVLDRWLDRPWLIRRVAGGNIETSAKMLGALTVSMLRGEAGRQRKEVRRLRAWLEKSVGPDLVNLSNILIAGCVPYLKRRLGVPVLVTLQGDDLFLDQLSEPYRQQALDQIRELASDVDGFLVFSRYYAEHMAEYLGIPAEKMHIVSMGVDLEGYPPAVEEQSKAESTPHDRPKTLGYLARVCPEKGFHVLVDAFLRLRTMPGCEQTRLAVAGWLGKGDRSYYEEQVARIRRAGAEEHFHNAGVVDRAGKIAFLRSLDVLSVPTTYREPKGIFVLEALAAGVPVVQPRHGAFPELLAATGGGLLVRPDDPAHLAEQLYVLLTDAARRQQLAAAGQASVRERFGAETMARETLGVYRKFLE